jgi:hypothetical protein
MDFTQLQEQLRIEVRHRIERGRLTAALLARQTHLTEPHISNFLRGERGFSLAALDRVLAAQKLTIADLVRAGSTPIRQAARTVTPYGSVPLVTDAAAMYEPNPLVNSVLDRIPVRRGILEQVREKCNAERRVWERFVAVAITLEHTDAMERVVPRKGVIFIDRHYNSAADYSSDQRSLYAVNIRNALHFRYVELTGRQLTFRAESLTHEVNSFILGPGKRSSERIIGRVFRIDAEL